MHPRISALLEEKPVAYRLIRHRDFPIAIKSPADFAQALGYEPVRITKTLLLRSTEGENYCLAVVSAPLKVDFAFVATQLGVRRVQMAAPQELKLKLGYPPMSVSPLAAEGIPVFLDGRLCEQPTVLIGSGALGSEIEIAPHDLIALTGATVMARTPTGQ